VETLDTARMTAFWDTDPCVADYLRRVPRPIFSLGVTDHLRRVPRHMFSPGVMAHLRRVPRPIFSPFATDYIALTFW
jgi:hypothetical protein